MVERQGVKINLSNREQEKLLPSESSSFANSQKESKVIKLAEKNEKDIEKNLSKMTNKEFLSISKEDRLQYITTPEKSYNKLNQWEIITFNFSFINEESNELTKELNRDLYLKTTAGQVLPSNVKEVILWWETYTRENMNWEFFTPNNKRLIIHDWTAIKIWKIRNPEDTNKLTEKNQKIVDEFLKINPNSNSLIVKEATKRWIDIRLALATFWQLVEKTPKEELNQVLEDAFTEYDRMRDYNDVSTNEMTWDNYSDLMLALLTKFNSGNWKDLAKSKLKIDEKNVKRYENSVASNNERADKVRSVSKVNENLSFIENATIIAKDIEKVYWIPWSIAVAQAKIESGSGTSQLSEKHNNYFWIKSSKKGPSVSFNTKENYNWKKVTERAWFKVFWSMEEGFIGYANFLTKNKRYRKSFNYWADLNPKPDYYTNNYKWYDPDRFLQEITKAWYATDPNYYTSVVKIARNLRDDIA